MLWYLATPFSAYDGTIEEAYILACEEAALLLKAGIGCFSPIAHTYGVAIHGEIDPLDHGIWMPFDRPMMDRCDGLVMLMAPGWQDSEGMSIEREEFDRAGKPVVWMTPGVVPPELVKA